jgi:hypothetical protein
MFEIEKNILVPPKQKQVYRGKYPFAQMQVGDSFFVRQEQGNKSAIRSSAQLAKKALGFRFIVRTDNDNTGVRVWRVA